MSGHSKWHSIRHKKGALDAKRGKIFTKHAKLITIAARDGGDNPDMNPGLRTAIANAKADNVPNANIDKAIKKGAGTDKDGVQFSEIMYEGFGPAGTAFYVYVITDNKNRAVTSVKIAFQKNGGNIGEAGTVGWMFEKKGLIIAKAEGKDLEEAELEIIDAGAEDLDCDEGVFTITTEFTDLMKIRDILEQSGYAIEKAEMNYKAKDEIKISDKATAEKVMKLYEALEDDEEVSAVFGNFEIDDEILEQL